MKNEISIIIMASGRSSRFGDDKLLFELNGKPVICHVFDAVKGAGFNDVFVVLRKEKTAELARSYGFETAVNDDPLFDTSKTIMKGMEKVPENASGVMLLVADQPYISSKTLSGMADTFAENEDMILRVAFSGIGGNPVIFPRKFFDELKSLDANGSGRTVIKRHSGEVRLFEIENEKEIFDIDTKEDILKLREV